MLERFRNIYKPFELLNNVKYSIDLQDTESSHAKKINLYVSPNFKVVS